MMYSKLKTFPEVVAAWKGERNLVEAAHILSVSPSTIHYWLKGESLPPQTKITALASLLGIPVKSLTRHIKASRAIRFKAGAK